MKEKERTPERKREKINAIIDAAVLRAILRNKLKQEISSVRSSAVTGKPGGLRHKQSGHVLHVSGGGGGEVERPEDVSGSDKMAENYKQNLSSTTNTTVLHPADVGKTEEESNSDPSRYVSSRKLDIEESRTQIDPSLDSLTREFLNIMQGEKSAINNPYYR